VLKKALMTKHAREKVTTIRNTIGHTPVIMGM
jgi:hypothetical protein